MALDEYPEAEYVDVSRDAEAYARLMESLWRAGQTFVVVEQDRVPVPGALRELADCPEPLCAIQAPMFRYRDGSFMLAPAIYKYGAELLAWWPDQPAAAAGDGRHWRNVYHWYYDKLAELVRVHVHEPPAKHVHPERFAVAWEDQR